MKKLNPICILRAKKKLFIFILLVFGCSFSFSQSSFIKGRVIDAENHNPVSFAIVLLETNGAIVTGGATDINGLYHLKVSHPGEYNIILNYVDYQPKLIAGVSVSYGETHFLDCEIENRLYAFKSGSMDQKEIRMKEKTL